MTENNQIMHDYESLLNQETPPIVELRKSLLELEELVNSSEYQDLNAENREKLQEIRRMLKEKLRQLEGQESSLGNDITAGETLEANAQQESKSANDNQTVQAVKKRDPEAEIQMEEAEKLFYSGRYAEAIKLFDSVLQTDENWERARQHRTESENYLRTGYIPPVALPADAASAFGKAQSAARVGRYTDALSLLSQAQQVMRDMGIQRWQEGLEFEQKLQENIDAERAYQEGIQLFEQGEIDDAIDRVETAARTTGLPKYADKAGSFRQVREKIKNINEVLSALNIDPAMVAQAKADLDMLTAEYGENPSFARVKARLESNIPRAVSPLKDDARSLKAQAERAVSIEETLFLANQAKNQLAQIRNLEGMDDNLDRLQTEIDRLIREVERYEDELSQATTSYENHKRWPAQAARLSQEVRGRYPNDPAVMRLNRSLSTYFATLSLLKFGMVLLIIGAIALFGWWGIGRYNAFVLSLTPTPTSSPTITPSPTSTITPTSTATITATSTASLTPSPTSTVGIALRDIWARSGCYEGFTAIGRIPTGGELEFLPAERRFDQFNRECVLIEHQGSERSVIGWVLFADIGSPPQMDAITPTP